MRTTTLAILSLSAATVRAAVVRRQSLTLKPDQIDEYYSSVCLPATANQMEDLNAPCWQVEIILDECTYGTDRFWGNASDPNPSGDYNSEKRPQLSARDHQICLCESEMFQAIQGCLACVDKHGLTGVLPDVSPSAITSFSSSYCAATNTPSVRFDSAFPGYASSAHITATAFTDPIGNKTAVSNYFTPAVTGVAAYSFSYNGPLASTSVSTTTSRSINIANGQIVPTASGQSASTSTKNGGAMVTAPADRIAVAGVIGLAAIVAAL